MNINEAREIINQEDYDTTLLEKHRILKGLQILSKYDDTDCYSGYDILWCSDFVRTVEKMSKEDFIRMLELGWFEDNDSWSHCC